MLVFIQLTSKLISPFSVYFTALVKIFVITCFILPISPCISAGISSAKLVLSSIGLSPIRGIINLEIFSKLDKGFKTKFYDYVYNNNFSFAKVNKWYKDNFGELFPLENFLVEDTLVFSEKLTYESSNIYKDGVSLKVSDNYLVPVLESGIVIFVGEKESYGNTVIVQQENGIDVWYSNINYSNINMYDYVEKSSFIGEVKDNNLILILNEHNEKDI